MKRFIHNIQIFNGDVLKLSFPTIITVEIESNRIQYTDTALITFNEGFYKQNNKISDLIKKGDRITIEMGYHDTGLIKEFDGYVSGIVPGTPVQLKCQDDMYLLKQQTLETKVFKKTNLKELISYYYKGKTELNDCEIGDWVVGTNSTLVDLFEELKQQLGILTYFQDKVLYCNAELIKEPEKTVIFNVNENVPINGCSINVEEEENYSLVVHGISPQKNGTKIERYAYYEDVQRTKIKITSSEPDGVMNLVNIHNITQDELDKLITQRLPKIYEGTTGGEVMTFGFPSIKHSDRAQIIDVKNPSNEGLYDILGVVKTFSMSDGYKQKAKIGLKIQ